MTAGLILAKFAKSDLTWATWSSSLATAILIALAAAVPAAIILCLKVDSSRQVLFHLALFCLMLAYAVAPDPIHALNIPFLSWVLITLAGLSLVAEVLCLNRAAAGGQVEAAVTMYLAGALAVLSLSPLATHHLASHVERNSAIWALSPFGAAILAQTAMLLKRIHRDCATRWGRFRWATIAFVGVLSTAYVSIVIRAIEVSSTVRGSYASASARSHRDARDDLIVLIADTVRADRVGVYNQSSATPFINAFATQGITYLNHVAAAPWTAPSVASIFTGRSPSAHGVHLARWSRDDVGFVPDSLNTHIPTLAELLRDQGYATAFVGTNPFLIPSLGFDRGFDYFANLQSAGPCTTLRLFQDRRVPKAYNAAQIVDDLIKVLDAPRDRPLALVGHFFDAHSPYAPPAAYRPKSDSRNTLSEAYDGEVAYLDSQFGRLWNHLKATRRLDHTVVVLTADHGEAFALRTAQAPRTQDLPAADKAYYTRMEHGHTMFQELLHVPFIIYGPRLVPRTENHTTRAVDVLPTIMASLRLRLDADVEGRDVLKPLTTDEPALSESVVFGLDKRSWREGRYKLVYRAGYTQGEQFELYDLASDPAELEDLARRRWSLVIEMSRRMDSYLTRVTSAVRAHSPATVDPSTLERLRSLGYIR